MSDKNKGTILTTSIGDKNNRAVFEDAEIFNLKLRVAKLELGITDDVSFTILPQSAINAKNERIEGLEKQLSDISDIVHGDTSGRSVDEICGAISYILEDDSDE